MPQLEVHEKQSAGAEVKPRVRTDPRQVTRFARPGCCDCESAKGTFLIEVGRAGCVPRSAKMLVM